jgi:hypothetical protein
MDEQLTTQMLPNKPGAQWENIPYAWNAAVNSLGRSYDLRQVDANGEQVGEIRKKTPLVIAPPKPMVGGTRANPNLEFERFWENSSQNETTKEQERNAFLAGWFGRQNAR